MQMTTYRVYALKENGVIRYVGITSQSLARRLSQHIQDASRLYRKEHKSNWVRKCLASGVKISTLQIRVGISLESAKRIERQIIKRLRKQLVNVHDGGSSGYTGLPEDAKVRHAKNTKAAIFKLGLDFKSISQKMHAAKARKRMESEPPDYQPLPDYAKPVETIKITNHLNGQSHELVLFPSRRRRDCYRVVVDGKEWKRSIGYDRMLRGLRTALYQSSMTTEHRT